MSGLITGAYAISARPTTTDLVASPDSTIPIASGANVHDFALAVPVAPPPEATITARTTTPEGIPVVPVFFSVLTTEGCANGTATYEIHDQAGALINGSGLPETPVGSGHYENIIGTLPRGRLISIAISVVCPVPDDNSTVDFDAAGLHRPVGDRRHDQRSARHRSDGHVASLGRRARAVHPRSRRVDLHVTGEPAEPGRHRIRRNLRLGRCSRLLQGDGVEARLSQPRRPIDARGRELGAPDPAGRHRPQPRARVLRTLDQRRDHGRGRHRETCDEILRPSPRGIPDPGACQLPGRGGQRDSRYRLHRPQDQDPVVHDQPAHRPHPGRQADHDQYQGQHRH